MPELLSRPDRPTAIFGTNDVVAAGAMKAAPPPGPAAAGRAGGDRAGRCLRLRMLEPELTSVHIDCRRMGELSVERLQSLLAGDENVPQVTVVPTELRVRRSA